jgi:hypothetical protein
VEVTGPVFLDPNASGGPGSWVPCGIFFRPCDDAYLFGQYGPFYSQDELRSCQQRPAVRHAAGNYTIVSGANAVRAGTGYDIWAPDYLFTSGPLKGTAYRSRHPRRLPRRPRRCSNAWPPSVPATPSTCSTPSCVSHHLPGRQLVLAQADPELAGQR